MLVEKLRLLEVPEAIEDPMDETTRFPDERLELVFTCCHPALAVAYLVFNEGYSGRGDLVGEALRLGRSLAELMPDEPEVHGLLALALAQDDAERRLLERRLAELARLSA
jgi:predicted RNA polymerase sigma factor